MPTGTLSIPSIVLFVVYIHSICDFLLPCSPVQSPQKEAVQCPQNPTRVQIEGNTVIEIQSIEIDRYVCICGFISSSCSAPDSVPYQLDGQRGHFAAFPLQIDQDIVLASAS